MATEKTIGVSRALSAERSDLAERVFVRGVMESFNKDDFDADRLKPLGKVIYNAVNQFDKAIEQSGTKGLLDKSGLETSDQLRRLRETIGVAAIRQTVSKEIKRVEVKANTEDIQPIKVNFKTVVYGKFRMSFGSSDYDTLAASEGLRGYGLSFEQKRLEVEPRTAEAVANFDFLRDPGNSFDNPQEAIAVVNYGPGKAIFCQSWRLTEAFGRDDMRMHRPFSQSEFMLMTDEVIAKLHQRGLAIFPGLYRDRVKIYERQELDVVLERELRSAGDEVEGRPGSWWKRDGVFTDQALLVMARLFLALKDNRDLKNNERVRICVVAVDPANPDQSLSKYDRLLMAEAIQFLLMVKEGNLMNWCTDPIMIFPPELFFRDPNELTMRKARRSLGGRYVEIDPRQLGEASQAEKTVMQGLRDVFKDKSWATVFKDWLVKGRQFLDLPRNAAKLGQKVSVEWVPVKEVASEIKDLCEVPAYLQDFGGTDIRSVLKDGFRTPARELAESVLSRRGGAEPRDLGEIVEKMKKLEKKVRGRNYGQDEQVLSRLSDEERLKLGGMVSGVANWFLAVARQGDLELSIEEMKKAYKYVQGGLIHTLLVEHDKDINGWLNGMRFLAGADQKDLKLVYEVYDAWRIGMTDVTGDYLWR